MTFKLPALPYSFDALEPYIDAKTMEVHHDKHHAAYTDKFNKAVEEAGLQDKSIEEIFAEISKHPAALKNNGGGYWNHSFFWPLLSLKKSEPSKELTKAINKDFGSFEKFKEQFSTTAANHFGSGWVWLGKKDGKLIIFSTPNQDSPLMDFFQPKCAPLLTLDIWEHAYYLNYQNRRPDYIAAFWNVVNWHQVSKHFKDA